MVPTRNPSLTAASVIGSSSMPTILMRLSPTVRSALAAATVGLYAVVTMPLMSLCAARAWLIAVSAVCASLSMSASVIRVTELPASPTAFLTAWSRSWVLGSVNRPVPCRSTPLPPIAWITVFAAVYADAPTSVARQKLVLVGSWTHPPTATTGSPRETSWLTMPFAASPSVGKMPNPLYPFDARLVSSWFCRSCFQSVGTSKLPLVSLKSVAASAMAERMGSKYGCGPPGTIATVAAVVPPPPPWLPPHEVSTKSTARMDTASLLPVTTYLLVAKVYWKCQYPIVY